MPALQLPPAGNKGPGSRASGRRFPGITDATAVAGQDDIDALLASMAGG